MDWQKRAIARRRFAWLLLAVMVIIFPACNLFSNNAGLQETLVALAVQQTALAKTFAAMTQPPLQASQPASTPLPPADLTLIPTAPPPADSTPMAAEVTADDRLMKSAKILLFEDMSASRYIRIVKEALDREDYFYIDVGSAKGWFKSQLLSDVEWDLVIAAAEARRDFGGEFFPYIDDRVTRGAGAIIEAWDLDAAPSGQVKPLLDHCGVKVMADWYEPEMRVFFWLVPEHAIFQQPNQIGSSLGNAARLWAGDVGDLLEVKLDQGQPAGDALLLAGTNPRFPTSHGTLATCLDGRLVLQTFSSHEYQHDDVLPLWENYIYQVLKNHFALVKTTIPTPAATVLPVTGIPSTPSAPAPGPAYTYPYSCGGLMTAQLKSAPKLQKDLFEHHAEGTFLILNLQLLNETTFPIQVWDGDYWVEAQLDGELVQYPLHKAATGYLYLDGAQDLYQDLIQPATNWRTSLAFDVDPGAEDLAFLFRPGSEFGEQVCEVRIPLSR